MLVKFVLLKMIAYHYSTGSKIEFDDEDKELSRTWLWAYPWTPLPMDMDEDFEAAPMSPLFVNPITTLDSKVLYNIIVFSKNSDLYLSFEWLNIFVGNLEVGFSLLWTWAFLPSYRISSFWAISMELGIKPNIDFLSVMSSALALLKIWIPCPCLVLVRFQWKIK